MPPDWASSPDRPIPPRSRLCTDCDEPLSAGRLMRCRACTAAAQIACQERQPGQHVLPSDIARIRARDAG